MGLVGYVRFRDDEPAAGLGNGYPPRQRDHKWLVDSARGFGALVSALMLASLRRHKDTGETLDGGAFIMPGMLFVFAWIRWLSLALVALVGVAGV